LARVEAVGAEQDEQAAEGVIDSRRGLKVLDGAEKFGREILAALKFEHLLEGVVRTERGVALLSSHAATLSTGARILASIVMEFCGHGV
jgi:hypothetical protein